MHVYARLSSGLSIKPKTHLTKMTILKEMVRSLGYDPEKILMKEIFTQPHRTVVDSETYPKKRNKGSLEERGLNTSGKGLSRL